mmetsp:Transcript_1330/g.1854  ORF Transcript_1330/g.1854 Transcript_1330/m.1854 type:complete len:367 (-) Transcript_1330:60-1160(-)
MIQRIFLFVCFLFFVTTQVFCAQNIWPQQVAFTEPEPTEWNESSNEDAAELFSIVGYAQPIFTPLVSTAETLKNKASFGFSVLTDFLPATPLVGESVKTYSYFEDVWSISNSASLTDDDGDVDHDVFVPTVTPQVVPVLHLLEAGPYYARSALWKWLPNTQAIVTDIDATLTKSDFEVACLITNDCDVEYRDGALALIQSWSDKGYQIVYLTTRPPDFYEETILQLIEAEFPPGVLRLANTFDDAFDAAPYKAGALSDMQVAGLEFVAAYGNADTDIEAYHEVGIPKTVTFIVGENGGDDGTVDVGDDWNDHITSYVEPQPDATVAGIKLSGTIGDVTPSSASTHQLKMSSIFMMVFILFMMKFII